MIRLKICKFSVWRLSSNVWTWMQPTNEYSIKCGPYIQKHRFHFSTVQTVQTEFHLSVMGFCIFSVPDFLLKKCLRLSASRGQYHHCTKPLFNGQFCVKNGNNGSLCNFIMLQKFFMNKSSWAVFCLLFLSGECLNETSSL